MEIVNRKRCTIIPFHPIGKRKQFYFGHVYHGIVLITFAIRNVRNHILSHIIKELKIL